MDATSLTNVTDVMNGSHVVDDSINVTHALRHPPLLKQSLALSLIIFLCCAYFIVLVSALVNNSLVLTVIYRNVQMRSVTNYFLANLAIADITVSLIVLPITLLSNILTGEWTIEGIKR